MKVIVLLAVLVVCYAQPPPEQCKNTEPPKIAETFESTTEVHRSEHGEPEFHGEGIWDRNVELGDALERTTFTRMGRTLKEERLWLFDKHVEYFIFSGPNGTNCSKRNMNENEKIPEVWSWLENAHCMRRHDPRTNKTFDVWESHIQDESITLFVDEEEPNTPLGLMRRGRSGEEDVRFTKFTPTAPPSSIFEPPAGCNTRQRRH